MHRRPPTGLVLLELLVAISLVALLAGAGLLFSFRAITSSSLSQERSMLLSLLFEARSHALVDRARLPWHLCDDAGAHAYILFSGTDFTSRSNIRIVPHGTNTYSSGIPSCDRGGVTFSPLSAETSDTTIALAQAGESVSLHLYETGTIDW